MSSINGYLLGLYEKALPAYLSWDERLTIAKSAGYDFIEISINETNERMARDRPCEKEELRSLTCRKNLPILTTCLSRNRKFSIGSENCEIKKGYSINERLARFLFKYSNKNNTIGRI